MTSHWSTNRMEAFSDGVFAIAITLLILEVHVPASEFDHLWRGIAHQWPAYLAYATSFLTIGGIWMIHHAVFRRLASANQRLMVLNLLLVNLLGWAVTGALLFAGCAWALGSRTLVRDLLIGAVLSVTTWYFFWVVLDKPLTPGILDGIL